MPADRRRPRAGEPAVPVFVGDGEMAGRMRALDWAATALGDAAAWPHPLRTLVALMLASRQPMFIAWGPAASWLYNDAFVPILGRKHPAALGRAALDDVWREARDELAPLFARVFAGDSVYRQDSAVELDRRGVLEEAHFSFSYTPVRDERGDVAGLFGACIETTARREAEAALREVDRRKDEFIATLSHELRNPLAPLRSALHVARTSDAPGTQVTQMHEMMERQLNHLVRLVDDLLEVSRIEHGAREVRYEPADEAAGSGSEPIDAAAPLRSSEEAGARSIAGRRILVVDDNRDAAESLRMMLELLGAEVHVAYDGRAALAKFAELKPAAVLLDIGMPEMNGYEVARAIRTRFAGHPARIVALTGWGQENDRRRSREAGFDHHLVKPADLRALERALAA